FPPSHRHYYGGQMNHKQPQKSDQCVNHLPGLKCKASARLDTNPQYFRNQSARRGRAQILPLPKKAVAFSYNK
ncbi:MAG: hypothetical protein ABSE55_17720, partial [Terracidiphilus sp.]